MEVKIFDTDRAILFVFDGQLVAVNKQSIISITSVNPDTVAIDIGKGVLNHLYIRFSEVTIPIHFQDVMLFEKFLLDCWDSGAQALAMSAPILEENASGIIYKGYGLPSFLTKDPVWAIQRLASRNGVIEEGWANGRQTFINVWDDRYDLSYQPVVAALHNSPSAHG